MTLVRWLELVAKLKLWDRFVVFLNQRIETSRAREKIEAISAKERASKRDTCSICKSTSHSERNVMWRTVGSAGSPTERAGTQRNKSSAAPAMNHIQKESI